ncbi:hypothetical protein HGA88_00210 [Candidatus Roizmanbacteria bacterium]|nr:hypothetical protein [Candidatus Roizmanbacteria bacterium]
MRKNPYVPFLFMGVLVMILIFVGGVRYGTSVEKTNKKIAFILSITPTPRLSPSVAPTVSFQTLRLPTCGISFLYPTVYTLQKSASDEAVLQEQGKDILSLNCQDPLQSLKIESPKTASESVKLSTTTVAFTTPQPGMYLFTFQNPMNRRKIQATVSKTYFDLFETTLEFGK